MGESTAELWQEKRTGQSLCVLKAALSASEKKITECNVRVQKTRPQERRGKLGMKSSPAGSSKTGGMR